MYRLDEREREKDRTRHKQAHTQDGGQTDNSRDTRGLEDEGICGDHSIKYNENCSVFE